MCEDFNHEPLVRRSDIHWAIARLQRKAGVLYDSTNARDRAMGAGQAEVLAELTLEIDKCELHKIPAEPIPLTVQINGVDFYQSAQG